MRHSRFLKGGVGLSLLALAAALSWGVISLFTVNTDHEGEYRHKTGQNDAYERLSDMNVPDFEGMCNTGHINTSYFIMLITIILLINYFNNQSINHTMTVKCTQDY